MLLICEAPPTRFQQAHGAWSWAAASSLQAPLPSVSSEERRALLLWGGGAGLSGAGLGGFDKEKRGLHWSRLQAGDQPGEHPRCFGVCEGAHSHADPGFVGIAVEEHRLVSGRLGAAAGDPTPYQGSGMTWGEREAASGSWVRCESRHLAVRHASCEQAQLGLRAEG